MKLSWTLSHACVSHKQVCVIETGKSPFGCWSGRKSSSPPFLARVDPSQLVRCHLWCISSGCLCKALNCICAFLLLPSVPRRAGETRASSTAPRWIRTEEVSIFERVLESDLHSAAPQSISCPSSFHRSVLGNYGASSHHQPAVQDINPASLTLSNRARARAQTQRTHYRLPF